MQCGAGRRWQGWRTTAPSTAPDSTPRLDMGYQWVTASWGTPRAGISTSEYGRDYRLGYGMQVLEQSKLNLELGIDAERRESALFQMQEQGGGSDQRVLGRATVEW